jgi:Flp pilus assembly protein TadG
MAEASVVHVVFEHGSDAQREQLTASACRIRLLAKLHLVSAARNMRSKGQTQLRENRGLMGGMIELRRLIRLCREERGTELVEFAFTALLLLAVVFGVIQFAMAMYAYHFASSAAQLGARYAIVRGANWTTSCSTSPPPNFSMSYGCEASNSDVQNYVKSLVSGGLSSANVSATTTWPATTPDCTSSCTACSSSSESQGCLVNVQVTYSFNFLPMRIFPQATLSLKSTAEQVIQ